MAPWRPRTWSAWWSTVQPKTIAHPPDRVSLTKQLKSWVDFAHKHGIGLRQSYLRVVKRAAIIVGRDMHARQVKRANAQLKFLRTPLAGSSATSPARSIIARIWRQN